MQKFLLDAEDRALSHASVYVSREEARADIFDYIEGFYNPRRHSTLGGISPMEFEKQAGLASRRCLRNPGQARSTLRQARR